MPTCSSQIGAHGIWSTASEKLCAKRPGLVHAKIVLHGETGPWSNREGFDEIAGAVTGLFAIEGSPITPKLPPITVVCDYIAGWLTTVGITTAFRRRAIEGGSYRVVVSLTRTTLWLLSLGIFDKKYAQALAEMSPWIGINGLPNKWQRLARRAHSAAFSFRGVPCKGNGLNRDLLGGSGSTPRHCAGTTLTEISYSGYRFPPEIIQHTIWLYLQYTLSGFPAQRFLSILQQLTPTFNVHHVISARTHRAFRDTALQTWREALTKAST